MDTFSQEKQQQKRLSLITKAACAMIVTSAATYGIMSLKEGQKNSESTGTDFSDAGTSLVGEDNLAQELPIKVFGVSDTTEKDTVEMPVNVFGVTNMAEREASSCPMQYLMRVNVGQAMNPHRALLNHVKPTKIEDNYWNDPAHTMNYNGWKHNFAFYGFSRQVPGTKRVAVGQALNPHRAMLNHPSKSQAYWNDQSHTMNYAGWQQYTEFWAFEQPQPGMIRVAVGQAQNPHRIMLNHPAKSQDYWNDRTHKMNFQGWNHFYEFWAYPQDLHVASWEYDFENATYTKDEPQKTCESSFNNTFDETKEFSSQCSTQHVHQYYWNHDFKVKLDLETKLPTISVDGKWGTSKLANHNFLEKDSWAHVDFNIVSWSQSIQAHTRVDIGCYRQLVHMRVPYKVKFGSKYGSVNFDLDSHLTGTTTKLYCAQEDIHYDA